MNNKLIIPAILAATVLIAGIFVLMPVEKASTVHTTILAANVQLRTDSVTVTTTGVGDDAVITISSDKDYTVIDIVIDMSAWDAGDVVQVEDFAIGGVNFIDAVDVATQTYTGTQDPALKTIEDEQCRLLCSQDGISAPGGTDITFELDITALDDASESIPITVFFLTTADANIDVQSTT